MITEKTTLRIEDLNKFQFPPPVGEYGSLQLKEQEQVINKFIADVTEINFPGIKYTTKQGVKVKLTTDATGYYVTFITPSGEHLRLEMAANWKLDLIIKSSAPTVLVTEAIYPPKDGIR